MSPMTEPPVQDGLADPQGFLTCFGRANQDRPIALGVHPTGVDMKRVLILIAALGLLVAACSSSSDGAVASLSDTETTVLQDTSDESQSSDEEILLGFAACMRDNGAEDFEDPTFDADGVPQFNLRGDRSAADRGIMEAAFEACRDNLEGLVFGPGSIDFTEVQTHWSSLQAACATTDTTCLIPTSPASESRAAVEVRLGAPLIQQTLTSCPQWPSATTYLRTCPSLAVAGTDSDPDRSYGSGPDARLR